MNQHVHTAEDDRIKSLEAFANNSSPQNVVAVAQSQALAASSDRVFGAIAVAVHRDERKVLQKLKDLGAAAGDHWFYRIPFKNKKKGTTEYVEGPTIKLANDLARIYGNCEVQTRVIDLGSSWLIYARFTDYETGYATERPFQQQKGGSRIGGDDDARRLDMALQIGVSKAIRNVVVNALQTYADFAFEEAKHSLVDKIGKNLQGWRERTAQGIDNMGVELVRAELVVGKAIKDWNASDVARVIAMMKGVADGMATIEETFPSKEAAQAADGKLDSFAKTATTEAAAVAEDTNTSSGESTSEATETGAQKGPAGAGSAANTENAKTNANTNTKAEQQSQTDVGTSPQTSEAMEGAGDGDGGSSGNTANAPASSKSDETGWPKTDAEYRTYAGEWIEKIGSRDARMARWSQEKKMRNKANVSPETREFLENLVKKKD